MGDVVLTDEQQAAVSWLVEHMTAGTPVVALRGYAGCGKSAIIPHLRQALAAHEIPVRIGSPTHRAARMQHSFTQATQVSVGPVPWPQEESIAMSEPSKLAPLFVAPPPEADTPFDLPGDAPLHDDIPEVPVPGPVLAALASEAPPPPQDTALLVDATTRLLEGKITDWVQTQSTATMRVLDQVYGHVAACLDKIAVANDHAQYQLATALDRLGEQGVSVHPTPYVATLQALSPQGFPLTLTLRKRSAEELVMALEQLGQWLHQQGYFTPTGTVANAERLPF